MEATEPRGIDSRCHPFSHVALIASDEDVVLASDGTADDPSVNGGSIGRGK